MSFSDIMSALLVIFILASVILILQLMEMRKELEERRVKFQQEIELLKQAEEVRRSILDEAVEALRQRNIRVEISENDSVLRIPNELLGFDTGAYELQARYEQTAREIGEVLNQVLSKEGRLDYLDTIFIEGHTDNRPYQGLYGTGNWGLSTFRAISLWKYWSTALPESEQLDRMLNRDGKPLFSVSGYAETRPVPNNDQQSSEEQLSKNRRIDIRFTIRRPDSLEYEATSRILGADG